MTVVLGRMALIVLAALLLGGVSAGIIGAFLSLFPNEMADIGVDQGFLVFCAFMLPFLGFAIPLIVRLMRWYEFRLSQEEAFDPIKYRAFEQQKARPWLISSAKKEKRAVRKRPERKPALENKEELKPAPRPDPLDQAAQIRMEPIPRIPSPGEEDKKVAFSSPQGGDGGSRGNVTKQQTGDIKRFRSSLMSEIGDVIHSLDAYGRFGVDLIMAGAVDCYASANQLSSEVRKMLMEYGVKTRDVDDETAKKFADEFGQYASEPRYKGMIETGRMAMKGYLSGSAQAIKQALDSFNRWNTPSREDISAKPQRIGLYAAFSGLEALTRLQGEQGGRRQIEGCARLIGEQVRRHSGQEATPGDDRGVGALFANAADGMTAAIAVQRAVAQLVARNQDTPLRIKIGVGAGDDDGSATRKARQICEAGEVGRIVCSDAVRALAGKGFETSQFGGKAPSGGALWDVRW